MAAVIVGGMLVNQHQAARLHHRRREVSDDVDGSGQVHGQQGVDLGGRDLPKRRVAVDQRGVVDDEVRRLVLGQQGSQPRADLVVAGHVHPGEVVGGRVLLPQATNGLGVPPASQHGVPRLGEAVYQRAAFGLN